MWLAESPFAPKDIGKNIAHLKRDEQEMYREGEHAYSSFCSGCHGVNGEGIEDISPPLINSEFVNTLDKRIPISILLHGMTGPITVAGKEYQLKGGMPGLKDNQSINDGTIAKILTFIRNSWGNQGDAIRTEEVSKVRISPPIEIPPILESQTKQKLVETNLGGELKKEYKSTSTSYKKLFNGKNLDGWHIVGGDATYKVKNGSIVGYSKPNTPNTFLVHKEQFADFILDVDIWIDTMLNSGVQIRSNRYNNYYNGVFHGYQIEVDPSSRSWSGGLYDESRRAWLYSPKDDIKAQNAFKNNEWNHYTIKAIGPSIKTYVNGILVTDYIDSLTRSGYIGLQVHGIGQDTIKSGKIVQWKNVKIEDRGGILWSASEEDKTNLLYHVYDNNFTTAWVGDSLEIDCRTVAKRKMTLKTISEIDVLYSADNKNWKQLATNQEEISLPSSRYLKLKHKNKTQKMVISEILIR